MQRLLIILLLLPCTLFSSIEYHVEFQGFITKETLDSLLSNSTLKLLEEDPPANLISLKRRAEADIPNLVDTLHSLGFYNARVDFAVVEEMEPVRVVVSVDTGAVYPILGYQIEPVDLCISLRDIGITLGGPAYTNSILEGESKALEILAVRGYPLASVVKRRVIADQEAQGIFVILTIDPGLQVVFGSTTVVGLETVSPSVVINRVAWCEGKPYDPELIGKTEFELESLGLFSSISILENEEELDENELPIEIYLKEACHRTIGFGVSYNTQLGPGATFNWEHRNMRGLGERFKIKSDIWQRKQTGILQYIIPDFRERYQQLRFLVEADKEITEGYDEFYYSGSVLIDKRINPLLKVSYGGSYKQLFSSKSDNNRPSHLLKIPLYLRYNCINNPLCPTDGYTLTLRSIPTLNIHPQFAYAINTATVTGYYPIFGDDFLVIAGKAHLGSIFGSKRITIPPPERFYAGSPCLLRGYKYMTVSPLDRENKPIGGRSIMVYSLETRFKLNSFGWAFFYEVGNVYNQIFPQPFHKQLQSIGLGFHYYTQVGPLRLDVAFPLDPRKKIDRPLQFYISIGQSF